MDQRERVSAALGGHPLDATPAATESPAMSPSAWIVRHRDDKSASGSIIYWSPEAAAKHAADYLPGVCTVVTLVDAAEAQATIDDAGRFVTLCETSGWHLCFMGQSYPSTDEFRAAIDAYRGKA